LIINYQIMQAVDVYLMYCALKAHFQGDYDYHKFGGKTKTKRESYYKRKDRFFFAKTAVKYEDTEVLNYFVSNFIHDRSGYIANFTDKNYETWMNKRAMFYEIFSQEMQPFVKNFEPLFECKDNQHPLLLKEYMGKRISLETMIVLDDLVEYSKKWKKELEWDDFVWPDVKKLMNNYKGFLTINTDKYRMKLLKLIEESS
tara:strand:- start:461 stop:1060 length:600 start_codon:yes stop_codon:yes gene_type:complete